MAGSWSLPGPPPTFPAPSQSPGAPAACPVASCLDRLPIPPAPLQTPILEGVSTPRAAGLHQAESGALATSETILTGLP